MVDTEKQCEGTIANEEQCEGTIANVISKNDAKNEDGLKPLMEGY